MEHSAAIASAPVSRALRRSLLIGGFVLLFWVLLGAASAHADEGSHGGGLGDRLGGSDDSRPARVLDRAAHAVGQPVERAEQPVERTVETARKPVEKVVDRATTVVEEPVRRTTDVVRDVQRNANQTVDRVLDSTLGAAPEVPLVEEPADSGPRVAEAGGSPTRPGISASTAVQDTRATMVLERLDATPSAATLDTTGAAAVDRAAASSAPAPAPGPVSPSGDVPGGEPVQGSTGMSLPLVAGAATASMAPAALVRSGGDRRTSWGLQPAFAPGSTPD